MSTPKFTPDDVREILLSDAPYKELSRRFGASRELLRRIKNGTSYAGYCPDIIRLPNRAVRCHECNHWELADDEHRHGYCSLGIPESQEPGVGQHYARLCATFIPAAGPVPEPTADAHR